jgi:glutamate-1-semialdehyde 2,1-aminomutase
VTERDVGIRPVVGDDASMHALAGRARAVMPGGVNSGQRCVPGLEDLVIVSTGPTTFTDASNRTFLDFHAAFGPPLLGHHDPDVDRAVAETIRRVDLVGVGVTPLEIQLAERLVRHVPSIEKVLLTVSGSEATAHAIRVSRVVTGRRSIVKFQGCYHGFHDQVAMNVISPADRVGGNDPLSKGILSEVLDATIVLPFNDAGAVERAFEGHPDEIAAVIVEPIPHNIGAVLPLPGFLARLRELCTAHGALLILDEVVTGFRHGLGGYQAIEGITPDLTTMGKAMANGYPMAALGGAADVMDLFSSRPGGPAFFAGTFNGHPATVAASLATIRKLEEEPVHEHIYRLGERARTELRTLFEQLGVPVVVTGFGSVFVTYFMEGPVVDYRDLLRNDVERFVGYRRELMPEGVFELPLNLKRSHMSFAHTDADVDRLLEATESAVRRVLAGSAA